MTKLADQQSALNQRRNEYFVIDANYGANCSDRASTSDRTIRLNYLQGQIVTKLWMD